MTITKWDIRARAAKKVTVGADGKIDGTSWGQIARYQKEFQEEYCPKCIHFNLDKNCFCEQAYSHVPDLINCKHHRTDIIGQCWGFETRGHRKPFPVVEKKESPIMVLPTNPDKIKELEKQRDTFLKALDYYENATSLRDNLEGNSVFSFAFFANALLDRLFRLKQVSSWGFFKEAKCFFKEGGIDPLPRHLIITFNDACNAVERLCK